MRRIPSGRLITSVRIEGHHIAIPDKQIEQVMSVLTKWNPLGNMASSISNLDDYRTESIDILFNIDMSDSTKNVARSVQNVLNEAFDLDLSLEDCREAAEEIKTIIS